MIPIDQTIGQIESLYRAVTGRDAPPIDTPYTVIPPEKDPMLHVEEQLQRLKAALGQITSAPLSETPAQTPGPWAPPAFVADTASEIVVSVDLPGVPVEAIECVVSQNTIVVSGNRPLPVNGDSRPRLAERPMGAFRRVLVLPTGVQGEQISAQHKDGVMTIRIPRGSEPSHVVKPIPVK